MEHWLLFLEEDHWKAGTFEIKPGVGRWKMMIFWKMDQEAFEWRNGSGDGQGHLLFLSSILCFQGNTQAGDAKTIVKNPRMTGSQFLLLNEAVFIILSFSYRFVLQNTSGIFSLPFLGITFC